MKLLEKVLAAIAILSVIMIYLSIPWGYLIFLVSMGVMAWLYWPFGFAFLNDIRLRNIFKRDAYQGIGIEKLAPAFLAGQGIAVLCIGIVFWFSRYLFGEILLMMGFFLSIIAGLVIVIMAKSKSYTPYRKMIKRLLLFNGLALLLYLMPMYFIEYHIDPLSLDPFEIMVCNNSSASTESLEELVLNVNELVNDKINIRGIDFDSSYLLIYCDNWYYRVNPAHANLYYRDQEEGHSAHIEFRKKPGEPRLEMYYLGKPDYIHWEDQTTHLFLPDNRKDEFLKGVREIFCRLGK